MLTSIRSGDGDGDGDGNGNGNGNGNGDRDGRREAVAGAVNGYAGPPTNRECTQRERVGGATGGERLRSSSCRSMWSASRSRFPAASRLCVFASLRSNTQP